MKKTFDFKKPSESLPETSGTYLCNYGNNHIAELSYSAKHHAFNTRDFTDYPQNAIEVNCWAVMPAWRLTK